MTDAFSKNALGPFVLRLALAVIFIYHGLSKIANTDNTWGASWAVTRWRQQSLPPKEVEEKLDDLKLDADEVTNRKRIREAKDSLRKVYAESRPELPATLNYHAAQLAVAWGELLGGFALLLGLLTRWAAAGLLIIQVGAILTVTAARGFSFAAGGGFEYNLALAAMCLTLILVGGGTLAVDCVWRSRRQPPPGTSTAPMPA